MASSREGSRRPLRPRDYRSPRREEQARRTRRQVLDAARAEFLAAGYSGTTMRAVATSACVSLATVELAFRTKSALLKEVIDVAIAGDDEPVAVLDRPWAAEAASMDDVDEFLAAVAATVTDAQQRSARLIVVLLEAAHADASLQPLAEDRLAQRAATAAWIADGISARAHLRSAIDRDHAVDTIWLLMEPLLYCRLTEDRGWTPQRYRDWFGDSTRRLLL